VPFSINGCIALHDPSAADLGIARDLVSTDAQRYAR
jgi:hypothetical protein